MLPTAQDKMLDDLSKNNACSVIITCSYPDHQEKMHVNFTYEGDKALVSYLLEGAQSAIEEEILNDLGSGV